MFIALINSFASRAFPLGVIVNPSSENTPPETKLAFSVTPLYTKPVFID